MGSHGEDVVMSQAAKDAIPANFECKSLAIVIVKQNGCKPLAVIDAEVLFDMMAGGE